jgi:hypothetical protein
MKSWIDTTVIINVIPFLINNGLEFEIPDQVPNADEFLFISFEPNIDNIKIIAKSHYELGLEHGKYTKS